MKPHNLEQILAQTLQDRRLSGPERTALGEVFAELLPDAQRTAAARRQAFELSLRAIDEPKAREVVGWLEDVVKLLHPVAAGGSGAVSEACFSPGHDLCGRVASLFQNARRTAEVCVFTITDDRITEAILGAHRRGVKVRVVSDNDKRNDLGSDIDRLGRAGIPVRLDRTEHHMHHKFALFDGERLVNGSFNWTRSAGERNSENFVLTNDVKLVKAFQATFDQLWKEFG